MAWPCRTFTCDRVSESARLSFGGAHDKSLRDIRIASRCFRPSAFSSGMLDSFCKMKPRCPN